MRATENIRHLHIFSSVLVIILLLASQAPASEKTKLTFTFSSWVPFASINEEGMAEGLYIDILREIFVNQLETELVFKQVPWKRAQYNIENGLADLLVTVPTEKRLTYAKCSRKPLLDLQLRVYTYSDHPLLDTIGTISSAQDILKLGLIPVTNIGNGWHKLNIDSAGIATQYVSDEEAAFKLLARRRADITIEPIHAGSYLITKLGLKDRVRATPSSFGPLKIHLLFSRKSPYIDLMPKVDAAIDRLEDNGFLASISEKYIDRQ